MGRPRKHDEETRAALLVAAERSVADGGPDALSVRAVADAAGTTTRAVYSLFGSRDGLVAGLAQRAYELVYDRVEEVPETDDPEADLVAVGFAFRRFVREHPALYRIAWQRVVGLEPEPGLTAARERAFAQLQERVRRVEEAGLLKGKAVRQATAEVIAMFEGLANAELRGCVLPTIAPGEEERAWREGVATLVRGFRTGRPASGRERKS